MYEYHDVKKEAEEKQNKVWKFCNGVGSANIGFIAIIIMSAVIMAVMHYF